MYTTDKRIVITLDAGGTNLVFGAMRGCKFIIDPITYPAEAQDLDRCLGNMVKGFREVISKLDEAPVAISFAFPGSIDYEHGIVGGLIVNFPSFRNYVALGPYLEREFGIPVFINNDGDLFAYGEALCGCLPEINRRLEEMESTKRYHNLLGYTFGSGFGSGMVIDGKLNRGDNGCIETYCLPHKTKPGIIAQESISIGGVKRMYREYSGEDRPELTPKDICEIADGKQPGDREAARRAFAELGETAGYAMVLTSTTFDGIIVIGGGLAGARHLIVDSLLKELRGTVKTVDGTEYPRMMPYVYNLDNPEEFQKFADGDRRTIYVHGTNIPVEFDPMKRVGLTFSKLGASMAISAGAYAFALSQIDAKKA